MNKGPYVSRGDGVLHLNARRQPRSREGHRLGLRLLEQFVTLCLVFVWLHGAIAGDLLVPIGEVPAGIEADRAVSAGLGAAGRAWPRAARL